MRRTLHALSSSHQSGGSVDIKGILVYVVIVRFIITGKVAIVDDVFSTEQNLKVYA